MGCPTIVAHVGAVRRGGPPQARSLGTWRAPTVRAHLRAVRGVPPPHTRSPGTVGRVTAAHARTRSPQRRSFVPALLAVVVALAVAFAALLVWQRNEQQKANRAAVAESAVALDEWDAQALGLLANPPIHLAALASPGDADGVAALRTACEEVQAHAETVAAATGPRDPAAKVPKDFPGRADVEARRTAAETGLTTYQERVAATAQTSATWCERYPLVVEAQQAQNAAIGTLDGLLAECRGSESGCVPLETDTWGQIADAVGPAYIEPAQRRGGLRHRLPHRGRGRHLHARRGAVHRSGPALHRVRRRAAIG